MDLIMELTESDAQDIEQLSRNKLSEYGKLNDVIGSQIFTILARLARVLYYPLEDEDIWGFVEKTVRGNFVCINTSIAYDKQVFVAAHELFHILQDDSSEELTLGKNIEGECLQGPISQEELKANRFAAAFLVNGDLLKQEMHAIKVLKSRISVQDVLRLANIFMVPYKTMARRLKELDIIDEKKCIEFMSKSHQELDIMKKRLGILTPSQDNQIVLDNLVETAMSLYENNRITTEKLEQILGYSGLCLEDMGVYLQEKTPLTDAEIDALLED